MDKSLFFLDEYTYKNNNKIELPLYLGTIEKENRYYWIKNNEELLYLSNLEEVITNLLIKPCKGRYLLINYCRFRIENGPESWMIVEKSDISLTINNGDDIFTILNPIFVQSLRLNENTDQETIKYLVDKSETCEYNIRLEDINGILEISSQEDKEKLRKYFCL
jgi:hypothetical protein